MRRGRRLWVLLLLVGLVACAVPGPTPSPTVPPQPAPAVDYRAALAALKTYRAHAVLEIVPDQATGLTPRRLEVTVEAINAPQRARRTTIRGLKDMARPQDRYRIADTLKFIEVGGDLYVSTGTTWLKTPAQNDPEQGILDPGLLIPDPQLFTLVGTGEEVNGIAADQYRFSDGEALAYLAAEERAALTKVDGRVWIAQEGNYIVRYRVEAQGTAFRFAFSPDPFAGRIAVAYDVTNVNEPLRIEPPRETLGAPATEEERPVLLEGFGNTPLPLPAGTTVLMQSKLLAVFDVPQAPDAVARFYANQLPPLGWALERQTPEGTRPIEQLWVKDGYELRLTIVASRQNENLTHVTVGVNPPAEPK